MTWSTVKRTARWCIHTKNEPMDHPEAMNYSSAITENGMNKIMNHDPVALEQSFLEQFLLSLHALRDNERIVIGLSG